ncbi:MAG: DUF3106 domain-containing protein [Bryobacterales bacterium]|nr:DUF3106 domain-containing protein [Bryobacterales bacterium]
MLARAFAILLGLLLALPPAQAQVRKGVFAKKGPLKKRQEARRAQMIDRLSNMTPKQRERALQRLPEERRKRVERNLDRYNELTPEQKQRIQRSARVLENMPPDKQQAVRQVYRRMTALPQERRVEIRREVNRLSRMSAEERQTHLNSDAFKNRFSPEEQGMVQELTNLFPPQ